MTTTESNLPGPLAGVRVIELADRIGQWCGKMMADFGAGGDGRPMTMIFASHNLGQVKRLASRVLYLERGRLLADLPVQDFFNAQRLQATAPAAHLFVKGELV